MSVSEKLARRAYEQVSVLLQRGAKVKKEQMMKAAVVAQQGAPLFTIKEVSIPQPGPGQVLIKVESVGVVFSDVKRRRGDAYPFPLFQPDACLINKDKPGASRSLHQDKKESNFTQKILSVSLGVRLKMRINELNWSRPENLHGRCVRLLDDASRLAIAAACLDQSVRKN